jgi:hypothetical protein
LARLRNGAFVRDLVLLAIFVLSVATLFLANEDPSARDAVCPLIRLCPLTSHAAALNKGFYDLAVGAVTSLIFYVLVVRLPDYQKRQRLKRGLERHYKAFREDCIGIMLLVATPGFSADPKTLLKVDEFKGFFEDMEVVDSGLTPWQEFLNNLDAHYLRELLTRMEILRDELAFVLNNTDIPNDESFEFMKRLSQLIYSMKDATLDHEDIKPLAHFIWQVFAGWDSSTGYRNEDIIERTIDAI